MRHPIFRLFAAMAFVVGLGTLLSAEAPKQKLRLPKVFSDHMVVQRDMPVPVWGWAEPGASVKVTLNGSSKEVKAGPEGKWMARLGQIKVGGPYELAVESKGERITISDVLAGEVWVCSGQSNMEWPVNGFFKVMNADEEQKAANYPQIRLFTVEHAVSGTPEPDARGGKWAPCSPQTVANFSASGYFFGRDLYKKLQVPVGLIQSSWGGTPAESWTSKPALHNMSDFAKRLDDESKVKANGPATKPEYEKALAAWTKDLESRDIGFSGSPKFFQPECDVTAWKTMPVPGAWEKSVLPKYDGMVWLRREFDLPKELEGKDLKLNLDTIDDADITWVNGTRVGSTDLFFAKRQYPVAASLLKPGKNVVVVRVTDFQGDGGFTGKADDVNIVASGDNPSTVSLAGDWKYRETFKIKDAPPKPADPDNPYRLAGLYNGMIAPIVPYAIRGAIWYQGESNADRSDQYAELFPAMIRDWRSAWKEGDFPFIFVQLANFMERKPEPVDEDWARLRDAQLKTLSVPKTGMAVAIDIGDAKDIHPKNKQEVGRRLALAAAAIAYKDKGEFSGPIYKSGSIKTRGNKAVVGFEHTSGGLVIKGDALKGFAVAGADKKFHWADAKIQGNSVEVSSPDVAKPVAVRYGWANNPEVTLYNGEGLPASPFRTDKWPGAAKPVAKKK